MPSFTEKPFYLFVLFNDEEIIRQFGDAISIAKVDGSSIVNSITTGLKIKNLKEVIFQVIRRCRNITNTFIVGKFIALQDLIPVT